MTHIFISYSTKDDALVAELRAALELRNLPLWVDSRNLRGGDRVTPDIEAAIRAARAMLVVISQNALNSDWIYEEVDYAVAQQEERGVAAFPIIPILLPGMTKAALKALFGRQGTPLAISLNPDPTEGGVEAAMPELLAALGERAPNDPPPEELAPERPLAELIVKLTDPRMVDIEQIRQAAATAELIFEPANRQARPISSDRIPLTAPLGPLELAELGWYLEKYYHWPVGKVYQQRAQRVEAALPEWGQQLYQTLPQNDAATREVWQAWHNLPPEVDRRFTIFVDSRLIIGSEEANEAATIWLRLPWELLHDGRSYLFQGGQPVQVRRRLPNQRHYPPLLVEPPLRVLLISPRPEEEGVGYIDHRKIAQPVTKALNSLGNLVELTMLNPPTFPALQQSLQAAAEQGRPYHVVHFDGHGIFDKQLCLGGLCFEDPRDVDKPQNRRMVLVHADEMAALLRARRIPLVLLNACQSAQTEEDPTTSVAAKLLDEGVASVIAMSHSVLVETVRRFVTEFYTALAHGKRVGQAMLESQQALHADPHRGRIGPVAEFSLRDWFVPVLYQESQDEPLFRRLPAERIRHQIEQEQQLRLGQLPAQLPHQFVGRSRYLLALERLLYESDSRYAVIIGQGGEGKTTLAVELARWLVQSHRAQRAVFLSVEGIDPRPPAADSLPLRPLIDSLGRQLLPNYSVAHYADKQLFRQALHPILRALEDQRVVLVVDNMESLLPGGETPERPPSPEGERPRSPMGGETPTLQTLLDLLTMLLETAPHTRLLLTSREAIPAPFADPARYLRLGRLGLEEATQLLSHHLPSPPPADDPGQTTTSGQEDEPLRAFVEAVQGHARSLVLLAPHISNHGVQLTTAHLSHLMGRLHEQFADDRERSLFASVQLSLSKLSPPLQRMARPLAMFQGEVTLDLLMGLFQNVEAWQQYLPQTSLPPGGTEGGQGQQTSLPPGGTEGGQGQPDTVLTHLQTLVQHLLEYNLATEKPYNHLTLHPALAPYLHHHLSQAEQAALRPAWLDGMRELVGYMYRQLFQDTTMAFTLTRLELPNLLHLLARMAAHAEPEQTLDVATEVEELLARLGQPRLLQRVVQLREQASQQAGAGPSNAQFEGQRMAIERLLQAGQLQAAAWQAEELYRACHAAGAAVDPYNQAMATNLLGQVLSVGGQAEAALALFQQAQAQFAALQDNAQAQRMAAVCLTRQGDCLLQLGRLTEAAQAYEEFIKLAEGIADKRGVAVGKGQLATVRLYQKEYQAALAGYAAARELFTALNEPQSVATIWHQTGMVYQKMGQFDEAERACRESLALKVAQSNRAGQASSLGQLGTLYQEAGRLEEAVLFYRQAADIHVSMPDMASEGGVRNNLGETLRLLGRYGEARRELQRAIECYQPYGHAAEPWKTYMILHHVEEAVGDEAAAHAARTEALRLYRAYRLAGGENHNPGGRLCLAFRQAAQAGQTETAQRLLAEFEQKWSHVPEAQTLAATLQQILAGNRDPALASNPALNWSDAVEVALLLAALG